MIEEEDKLLLLVGIFRSIFLTSQVIVIKMTGLNDVLCVTSYVETFGQKYLTFKLHKLRFIFEPVRSKIKLTSQFWCILPINMLPFL